jgi:hypothetical protein
MRNHAEAFIRATYPYGVGRGIPRPALGFKESGQRPGYLLAHPSQGAAGVNTSPSLTVCRKTAFARRTRFPMNQSSSSNPSRRLAHTRQIVCSGYARSDGLFDIEASLQDTKADDANLLFKQVPAGGPIHAMRLVVTIDTEFVIHAVEARTEVAPTPFCAEINAAYGALVGIPLTAGFMKEVKSRIGGARGCTHLTELLGPIATTAFQTIMGMRNLLPKDSEAVRPDDRRAAQPMLDTCHAWRRDGEVAALVEAKAHHAPNQKTDSSG